MSILDSAVRENPFKKAAIYSSYSAWRDEKLVKVKSPKLRVSKQAETAHREFREHVLNADFPCIGAKAAVNGNCYRFGFYPQMNAPTATAALAHDLWEYAQEQQHFATDYATFVVCFAEPIENDERDWEEQLWVQLQTLHRLDRIFYDWDASVGSDPNEADFSFSFAETAFFIVGLHPSSSRLARRFAYPTMVFNAHNQFERLREKNKLERMKETIRARDFKLQGSLNPNLSDFGERSEARQYSGRAVEENWQCPFHAQMQKAKKAE
jgi:FPC/CPF motif-containing protein YcgG